MEATGKFAGMSLNQDVRPVNAAGLLLGVCCLAFCFVGLNMVQPWLLEHHLNLPASEMGDATGTLGAIGQIITVFLAGAAGALADQKGRRMVLTLGVVVMALGILVAPLVSTLSGLIVSRTIFSIGRTAVAACFLIVVADYVQQNSRGKWNAFQGVTFGIGSILAAVVIVGMPKWLLDRGWDVIDDVPASIEQPLRHSHDHYGGQYGADPEGHALKRVPLAPAVLLHVVGDHDQKACRHGRAPYGEDRAGHDQPGQGGHERRNQNAQRHDHHTQSEHHPPPLLVGKRARRAREEYGDDLADCPQRSGCIAHFRGRQIEMMLKQPWLHHVQADEAEGQAADAQQQPGRVHRPNVLIERHAREFSCRLHQSGARRQRNRSARTRSRTTAIPRTRVGAQP